MWEHFLRVCQWALWQSNWSSLPDSEWAEVMNHRLGGHVRLIRFLTGNIEAARIFIGEMVAARKLLTENPKATLSDVSPNIDKRYLEEVPETADFLRPDNPDSLLDDKPRLVWRDRRIALHLPPVTATSAEWESLNSHVLATSVAGEMPINGGALESAVVVTLRNGDQVCTFELAGLEPYGLFDERSQRFANLKRSRLPTSVYRLISKQPLRLEAKEKDWAVEANQAFQLEDATQCYVSYLWPTSDRPELVINGDEPLRFGRREQINVRIYTPNESGHVLRFGWRDETLLVERLPYIVLEIPVGFLGDEDVSDSDLIEEFSVLINDRVVNGRWVFFHQYPDDAPEVEYYHWEWNEPNPPPGDYQLKVRSKKAGALLFGSRPVQPVRLLPPTDDVLLPRRAHLGKFWTWTLLAQIQDDPTREEFWIARQAVAGTVDLRINQNDWKKLEQHGYLRLRWRFSIQKCAIVFSVAASGETIARFAGLPNRLYSLVREVPPLRPIKVVEEHGLPACLEIVWPSSQRQYLRSICPREGITVVDCLWNR